MKLYPDDWQVRLITGAVVAACMLAVMLLGPLVGLEGFWPFMLGIVVAAFGGSLLGQKLSERLVKPPSANRPDHSPSE